MTRIMSEAWHITVATKRLEYMRAEAYWAKRRRETEKALVNWHVNKTKMLSMIFSDKREHEGHRLRHDIAYKFGKVGGFDLYGTGIGNRIPKKETALNDYMFTIVVENLKIENYFTEKIIDSCLVGSIPIYWGCPNIDKFLDINGIITFNTIDELEDILRNLHEDLYFSKIKHVDNNLTLAKKYEVTEDWIYLNILKELL